MRKRKCKKCKIVKNINQFYKNKSINYIFLKCKDCMRKQVRDKYNDIRIECFKAYGNKCSCCGESHVEFLTIDHIGGRSERVERDKRKHKYGYYEYRRLKSLNFPKDKYRLLCMNCNFAVRGNRVCPHKKNNGI